MAFLTRLVYLLIVLSIAADLLSLRDYLLSTGRRDGDPTAVQSSLFVPGASAIGPIVRALTKSAIKALKKKAKAAAKKAGNVRKKGRKGMLLLHFLVNYFPLFFICSLIIECAKCPTNNLILCKEYTGCTRQKSLAFYCSHVQIYNSLRGQVQLSKKIHK